MTNNFSTDYSNPPLSEVVLGIQFEDIKKFKAPHITSFWEAIGKKSFPIIQEADNLAKINQQTHQRIFIDTSIKLPRHWFIHKDENALIQIQNDRFLYNWRKYPNISAPYPRYEKVVENFYSYYHKFTDCLEKDNIHKPNVELLEITYINMIAIHDFGESLAEISNLLPNLHWKSDFLPDPKGLNLGWGIELEELRSRMQIGIVSVQDIEDGKPYIKMELTIKGASPSKNISECREWFDLGHNKIVATFEELTSSRMHKHWGKNEK